MLRPWYYQAMRGYTGVAFVGCVHTVTPGLERRLDLVSEYIDAFDNFALVFGGDLSSSKLLDDMKKHFYDAKRSNQGEIEALITLVESNGGFNKSRTRDEWLASVQAENYVGPWIGQHLSEVCRKAIEQGFIDNTAAICNIAKKFRDLGARVLMCGGNWDDVQVSRDTMGMQGIPNHLPALREMGVEIFEQVGHVRIGNVDLVFLPYWELNKYDSSTKDRLHAAVDRCAKKGSSARIAVAHAEPNWAVHNLTNSAVTQERAAVIANLGTCLAALKPDQVVYPHQHDPFKDIDGRVLGDDMKYLLRIANGGISLVEEPKTVAQPAKDIIVASYIPFQKVAMLATQNNQRDLGPEILGGTGNLVEVLSL